ncbi:unnamed protein product [Rotaria magnacalcarata]|uniref:Dynamin-type G domain-containing protein n=1 Tax=Rotaria magnacalcarata TaxID=392030 RepID=A0A816NUX5_9BILA|nr:unnamed protein product [Rotaria magnacalcarata]
MLSNALENAESRHLLAVVDEMREMLHHEKIALPQIVVVGDQSVGKSSVLEALSSIQLPRAQQICTRCPLELRMKNTTSNEYATIRCKGIEEMKITDFSTIASKVIACTIKLTGNEHDVSALPIYLTVYKKSIQEDLTLIDLPGITRNPVGGQSKDIYEKTVKLIMRYIEPPTAIILHVIPSSVDFTTSESIKISKEYDPNGERQLIAASKIDKYDKGIGDKLQAVVKAVQSNVIVNDFEINVAGLSNEYQAALDVQIAISAYCRVVQKRVADEIAQLCHYWLITCCALVMDAKFSSAFTSAVLFEWMREPFDQQQKRENLKRSILAMERALMAGQSV